MITAFSQNRASRITGVTIRQLQYWDEQDVLKPSIAEHEVRGLPRLYSFSDLLRLGVAKVLRDHRMLPGQIREMVREFEELGYDEPLLRLRFASMKGEDGAQTKEVFWIDPRSGQPHSARSLGQLAETFDLTLVEIKTGIEGKIADLSKREPGKVVRIRGLRGHAPVLQGTRVPTAKLGALEKAGWSNDRILEAFPQLSEEDVANALQYERCRRRTA